MTIFTLEAQHEKLAPANPFPSLGRPPLYHQYRTVQALERHHLVVNSYNTGTGKTVASLLHLFRLRSRDNVLFIAPTNALIGQHVADIRAFVAQNALPFVVAEVNATRLRAMGENRSGETLYRLLNNPRDYAGSLGLAPDDYTRRGIILVTNPDIFYYALFFRYGAHDQRNLFEKFASTFRYVVIDEFHYYSSKQFANFLFYFLLVQQLGWLDVGQRICLLSATPSPTTIRFLDDCFGTMWAHISPANEPPEADDLPTTPTLSPLEVTVVEGEMQEWARASAGLIREALDRGEHGALISSSLARVNESYTAFRATIGPSALGRITGPEPEANRQAATARPLILATPTVDIGYNFEKLGKPRQNVDFVACDGRYADELIQRLGRAGRVLGKQITHQPSRATLVLPQEMADAFRPLEGQSLSRRAFADWVAERSGLPHKHDLSAYIRSHAIMECFYPLWKVERLASPTLRKEIEALYERVGKIFAPGRKSFKGGPTAFFRRYEQRQRWLKQARKQMPTDLTTAQVLVDYDAWSRRAAYEERVQPQAVLDRVQAAVARPEWREALITFAEGQVTLTDSLFAFRDSFQGPAAAVYDPKGLLSSEPWNEYDLLHLVSNYRFTPLDREAFQQLGGSPSSDASLFLKLEDFRQPKLTTEFQYDYDGDEQGWKKVYCRRPISLRGLSLRARERGGDQAPLASTVAETLRTQWLVALVLPVADEAAVRSRLRGSTLYPRQLTIRFLEEDRERDDYLILLGTAAWLADAELRGYLAWRSKEEEQDAIIL